MKKCSIHHDNKSIMRVNNQTQHKNMKDMKKITSRARSKIARQKRTAIHEQRIEEDKSVSNKLTNNNVGSVAKLSVTVRSRPPDPVIVPAPVHIPAPVYSSNKPEAGKEASKYRLL